MKISAIVLAYNEEDRIQKCLRALNFASEIIVVDNRSRDKTVAIAKKNKARILSVVSSDFSHLRNLGAGSARFDWLLFVDADEIVSKELAAEIKEAEAYDFSAFYLPRQNYYFGHIFPYRERMIRLIKKDALVGWRGFIHETAMVKGTIGQLKNPLLHFTHNDLNRMVEKTNRWSAAEALLRLAANHPPVSWWRLIRVMASSFWKSYVTEKGYRAKSYGIIESIYQSFSIFITYAKLWELQNKKRKS